MRAVLTLRRKAGRDHNDRHVAFKAAGDTAASNGEDRTMYRFLECTAAQYMTSPVTTVTRQVTVGELGKLFEKHDFNSFPVVEIGNMLGIVTKFDFLRNFAFTTGQILPHYDELMRRPVAEMMTEAVVHVEPSAPLTRVLQLIVSLKTRSFPVLAPERQLVGIISREDVMRALKEATQNAQ
jgi:CBS domain-containing protein